jgi:imidazole glycerol-phosphate synthase subunit HisH
VIIVVDYGVNNLSSVVRALAAAGHEARLSADPDELRKAGRLVVPGVGHFGQGSRNLAERGLPDAIRAVVSAGRPVLGICLGLQLLFPESEEAPGVAGLAVLQGRVIRFRTSLPLPHVGWAEVRPTEQGATHPVLSSLFPDGATFYYHVHSFHPSDLAADTALGLGDYGGTFPTIVGRDNVLGVQFHPEKSQQAGIALLARFGSWNP